MTDPAEAMALVRVARRSDLGALLQLAIEASPGMTNLPPDEAVLAARLEASAEAMLKASARDEGAPMILMLEMGGRIVGTACLFSRIGVSWPFYSYRLSRFSQVSASLGRVVDLELLTLVNDFNGYAEVGGLFLSPAARGRAVGRLIARSRYMFIGEHRDWFGQHLMAEMRGVLDPSGRSPVWDAIGRRFYRMEFAEADRRSSEDTRFIAELGPKHPIYADMLTPEARAALGRPHVEGEKAYALLLEEGFRYDGYVDIFDGGPTLSADIATLTAVRNGRALVVTGISGPGEGGMTLVSAGRGPSFRAAQGAAVVRADGLCLSPALADRLGVKPGDMVRAVAG